MDPNLENHPHTYRHAYAIKTPAHVTLKLVKAMLFAKIRHHSPLTCSLRFRVCGVV